MKSKKILLSFEFTKWNCWKFCENANALNEIKIVKLMSNWEIAKIRVVWRFMVTINCEKSAWKTVWYNWIVNFILYSSSSRYISGKVLDSCCRGKWGQLGLRFAWRNQLRGESPPHKSYYSWVHQKFITLIPKTCSQS